MLCWLPFGELNAVLYDHQNRDPVSKCFAGYRLCGLANQSSNNPLFSTLRVSNLWGAGRSVGIRWGSLYEALVSDRRLHALLMGLCGGAMFCFVAHAPSTRSERPKAYDVGGRVGVNETLYGR